MAIIIMNITSVCFTPLYFGMIYYPVIITRICWEIGDAVINWNPVHSIHEIYIPLFLRYLSQMHTLWEFQVDWVWDKLGGILRSQAYRLENVTFVTNNVDWQIWLQSCGQVGLLMTHSSIRHPHLYTGSPGWRQACSSTLFTTTHLSLGKRPLLQGREQSLMVRKGLSAQFLFSDLLIRSLCPPPSRMSARGRHQQH